MATITTDIDLVARQLRSGQIAAIPTETVYGLAANAYDAAAVAQVFAAKERPEFDPLIVHIAEPSQLGELVTSVPPLAAALAARFWPGPLTLVLPKSARVPGLVTSGLDRVAVRLPDHDVARQVIRKSGVPLAAPSANLFGRLSPTTAAHVQEQLGDRIGWILDAGPCRVGVESTVVGFEGERPSLLRPGGVSLEELESVVGDVDVRRSTSAPSGSPGTLTRHYAPGKPIAVIEPDDLQAGRLPCDPSTAALLAPFPLPEHVTGRFAHVAVLADAGDLTTAAARFFEVLHELERLPCQRILAVPFPATGLGRALNDRLQRAAATYLDEA